MGRVSSIDGIEVSERTNMAVSTGMHQGRSGGWCSTDAMHTPCITLAHDHDANLEHVQ